MLWSCTLGSLPSVSKARKRSLGDWVFWDSRIWRCAPTPLFAKLLVT
jgi:hypothetical protein